MTTLFDPLTLGDLTLANRVIMAPLTRMRSKQPGNIPHALNAEYYAQRASAGLIISEATQISQQGQGYPATPGIHSPEQVEGWKLVTNAVHEQGGKIFLQLWHVGRVSHSSHQPGGGLPVAPSAIAPTGKVFTADWKQADYETPRALETSEIAGIVADYRAACENAKAAGFDGVEVHDGSNTRDDSYGGSIENRARLLLEVVDAAVSVWGKGRVGVRLSPYGTFGDMSDSNPEALFSYVFDELNARDIAYAHVIEPRATNAGSGGKDHPDDAMPCTSKLFRSKFRNVFISAGGYDAENAPAAVANGQADAIAFGRWFIANPDLPERLRTGAALTPYNRATFYGGDAKGYTDYPTLTASAA
jgi:N-ethylmaleimide reductase